MRKVTPQNAAKIPFQLTDVVTKVVPVPVEGWDAISPLASMDPKRAPIMDNWVPRPGWIEVRAGYSLWSCTNSTTFVETLIPYRPSGGTQKLFAASGAAIYDVSTGSTNASTVKTGLSSARWQYVGFTPAGAASVVQMANGIDELLQYNGSAWSNPSISGLPGGLNSQDIINIYAQKRRLWYILTNGSGGRSTQVAFMPTDAITGAIAGYIDFGALWQQGGYLVAMSDFTVDGGSGPQDYVAFISSRGQVSLYAGTDPTNSSAWSLVGTFNLAPPISDRCMTQVGSDVAIITQQGIVPLSQALPFDPSADRSVSITARIQNAMLQYSQQGMANFGWQVITYPAQQLVFVNVPLLTNQQQIQLVMNGLTGAWCRFLGWNANHFEVYNDNFYFGGNDGNVYLAWSGGSDLNVPIQAQVQCAFNYFDDPGREKRMTMAQPVMNSVGSGAIGANISIDEDFSTSTTTSPVSIIIQGAAWDSAVWDQSVWPNSTSSIKPWSSVQAIGHALAIHLTVSISSTANLTNNGEFDIATFDIATFDTTISSASGTLQVDAFNVILELGGFV